jgi:two-component system, NtrC family, sensor kinase
MRKGRIRGAGERGAVVLGTDSDAAPASTKELSSARARVVPEGVPTRWLDHLLVAVLDLPLSSGEGAVAEAMVSSLAAILPSYAVGGCFVTEPIAGRRDPLVVKQLPAGAVERASGLDPTRIFPGLAQEYVARIPGSITGSTLHLASDEDELDPHDSPAVHLIDRAAMALGRALPNARVAAGLAVAREGATALEQRMLQADKLATFGQIAAGVVHELNNPLTSIVAYSDFLIRRTADSAARGDDDVERLRRINESANRMLRFTRELVSYARPSSGAVGLVVIDRVIDQAIAFCEHVLAASRVCVERRYGADALTALGISEQLVQVFVNLITNACQAAPASDGRLIVATSTPRGDGRIVIHVEDNGGGISPEHLPHVFVPFFTTRSDRNGTGLGLSIVKSIVEKHDGEIRVESELGRGTRFCIELPRSQRA